MPHVGLRDPRGGTGWVNMSNILSLLSETESLKLWVKDHITREFKWMIARMIINKIRSEVKAGWSECEEHEIYTTEDYVNMVLREKDTFDGYIIIVPCNFTGIIRVTFIDCGKWKETCSKYYFALSKLEHYAELLNVSPRQLAVMTFVEDTRCHCGNFHYRLVAICSTSQLEKICDPEEVSLEYFILQQLDKIPEKELINMLVKMLQE